MMFPTKFINGTADITTNKHKVEIGWKKYIKHLINYHDGRFVKDKKCL